MCAAREEFCTCGCAFHTLRADTSNEIEGQVFEQTNARAFWHIALGDSTFIQRVSIRQKACRKACLCALMLCAIKAQGTLQAIALRELQLFKDKDARVETVGWWQQGASFARCSQSTQISLQTNRAI